MASHGVAWRGTCRYYLDGNIGPDGKSMSPLIGMDTTWAVWDGAKRTMTMSATDLGCLWSTQPDDQAVTGFEKRSPPGAKIFFLLQILRFNYTFNFDENLEEVCARSDTNRSHTAAHTRTHMRVVCSDQHVEEGGGARRVISFHANSPPAPPI